jgi:hypothetical protein
MDEGPLRGSPEVPKLQQSETDLDAQRKLDAVTRAEMIALASPPCHHCGEPVLRVEIRWHLDEDARWWPGPCFMICGDQHRVLVEPLL